MKQPLLNTTLKRLQATIHRALQQKTVSFPTETYRFTAENADTVYTIVRNGAVHHSMGQEIDLLEREFAAYHNVPYALATTTGTAALGLALQAIGLSPGDEVIVPSYTNVAVAQVVLEHGGIPIFVDIDKTFCMSAESVAAHISRNTKAILPVHMFGNMPNMKRIMATARKHHLYVIEDCCQATGAEYNGKKAGTIGHIGCFSFSAKNHITTGEGGMIITKDRGLRKKISRFRHQTRHLYQKNES